MMKLDPDTEKREEGPKNSIPGDLNSSWIMSSRTKARNHTREMCFKHLKLTLCKILFVNM